jgi:hypothetical protein
MTDTRERCRCAADHDEEPHTEADHAQDCPWARHAGPVETACGGCWGCLAAQVAYGRREAGS